MLKINLLEIFLQKKIKHKRSRNDRIKNAPNFKKHFEKNLGKEKQRKIRIKLDQEKVRKLVTETNFH